MPYNAASVWLAFGRQSRRSTVYNMASRNKLARGNLAGNCVEKCRGGGKRIAVGPGDGWCSCRTRGSGRKRWNSTGIGKGGRKLGIGESFLSFVVASI